MIKVDLPNSFIVGSTYNLLIKLGKQGATDIGCMSTESLLSLCNGYTVYW